MKTFDRQFLTDAASKLIRYPESLADAYTMLDEYVKKNSNNNNNNNNDNSNGTSGSVNAYSILEVDQLDAQQCITNLDDSEFVDDAWILLDTASTITIFNNPIYLRNIRSTTTTTTVHTSGGNLTINKEGFLPFLQRWVAFHPSSLGNILSF